MPGVGDTVVHMQDGIVEGKYNVERADGQPHRRNDRFFVLNYASDPFARKAMLYYAELCRGAYPDLAASLEDLVSYQEQRDSRRTRAEMPVPGTQVSVAAPAGDEQRR